MTKVTFWIIQTSSFSVPTICLTFASLLESSSKFAPIFTLNLKVIKRVKISKLFLGSTSIKREMMESEDSSHAKNDVAKNT